MTRTQQVLLPLIAVLALAGIGLGVAALLKDPSTASLDRQVRVLKADLASAHGEIVTLKADTAKAATAGNVSTLQTSVSGLSRSMNGMQNTIKQYAICIPQLQQEINGMSVQTQNNGVALTDAFLQNPTIVSNNCNKTLNG